MVNMHSSMFESIKSLIITLHHAGNPPSTILHQLKNLGVGREMADYLYLLLELDPDAVTYVYAWFHGSISDQRLDWLIEHLAQRKP